MPRNRKRTTHRGEWSEETLKAALNSIDEGSTIRAASKRFNIPFSTLRDRKLNKLTDKPNIGGKMVFTVEQEKALTKRIQTLDNLFYGLSPLQVRRIAYEFAECNNMKHNFSRESRLAGRDWLNGFFKRNPLSVRKPEQVSINRVTGFNRTEVMLFFDNLSHVIHNGNFTADSIYNMDETGVTTVQDPGKVVSTIGKKRVGSVVSWERGKIITVVCCMNAAGGYIPPMFIYPRKRMSPHLEKDGPPCSIYTCSHNGWSNELLFVTWLKHFIKHSKASMDNKVLLILDNHGSHATLESYELCRKNGVTMLSIPPHTSHRLQPLDVSLYSPLKSAFRRECDVKMKSACLQRITPYDIAGLFYKAYSRVANIGNATSGFKDTGIFPLNPSVFTDEDFLPADTLLQSNDIPDLGVENDDPPSALSSPNTLPANRPTTSSSSADKHKPKSPTSTNPTPVFQQSSISCGAFRPISPMPSTSTDAEHITTPRTTSITDIADLIPLPKQIQSKETRKQRPKQHSIVLTATPQKAILEERQEKRKLKGESTKGNLKSKKQKIYGKSKEQKKESTKRKIPQMKGKKNKKGRRKLDFDYETDDGEESEINEDQICDDNDFDDMPDAEDTDTCFVCGEFGRDGEDWFRCTGCGVWTHELCSGADSAVDYKCDYCSKLA